MYKRIGSDQYKELFKTKRNDTLKQALATRNFEIELYWKRATYFWTLIGAALVGYAAIRAGSNSADRPFLSVVLACLGALFSFGWLLVNKGSKQWQENWENHVDLLEDEEIGPLFKTRLVRRDRENLKERTSYVLTGPGPFSVSGVNQIISWFTTLLWCGLIVYALLPFSCPTTAEEWLRIMIVVGTVAAAFAMCWVARTDISDHESYALLRNASIDDPE